MVKYSIANILLISTVKSYCEQFTKTFQEKSFSINVIGTDNPLEFLSGSSPDLILIDIDCDDFDGFTLIKAIKENQKTRHTPIVAIAEEKRKNLYEKVIAHNVDDFFIRDFDFEELIVLIKPLLRLATMYSELNERVALAHKKGVQNARSTLIAEAENNPKILLVQPYDGDKATIETILEGKYKIESVKDFYEAEEKLITGEFVACINSLNKENMEDVSGLCARTRNNPRLFNLPMIVIDDNCLNNRMDAYVRGITRVINRPLNLDEIKSKLNFLIKRQRLRWAIRQAIETTKRDPVIDEITQGYNKSFFLKHFEQQVTRAHKYNKHISLIFFSISNLSDIQDKFGDKAGDHLIQQVYQWISSLVRVEDVVARYNDQEFCVALPDTPLDETQIVMHRIAGILSYTDFAINDVFQPLSVWVEVGSSTLDLTDTFDQIISKARKNID